MRTNSIVVWSLVGFTCVIAGCSCPHHGGVGPDADQRVEPRRGQTIVSLLDRVETIRRAGSGQEDYKLLVGSYGDGGAREGRVFVDAYDNDTVYAPPGAGNPRQDKGQTSASVFALAPQSAGAVGETESASIEVASGWSYIVHPPIWPLIRTPRVRGGTPMTSEKEIAAVKNVHQVYVAAYADGSVERIIYLGATDEMGVAVDCVFRVVADGIEATGTVDLLPGQYAEVSLSTTGSPPWGNVRIAGSVADDDAPADVRAFINYVHARVLNASMDWNENITPAAAPAAQPGGSRPGNR